jgi:hypothetical protein
VWDSRSEFHTGVEGPLSLAQAVKGIPATNAYFVRSRIARSVIVACSRTSFEMSGNSRS